MDEYLSKLNIEKDYDEMMKLMLQIEQVEQVQSFFFEFNIKILLSSFLMKNFYDYFLLDENDELIQLSIIISKFVLEKNLEKVGEKYKRFYELFVNWREEDINGMKSEINSAKTNLEKMVLDEPRDDADEQWNNGIKINMKLMDNTVKMLTKYSDSPPS